jgi:hypothetical protein
MSTRELEHLKIKGAFSIPSPDLRHHLLQSYLNFVHPCNPILDIQDLLAMEGGGGAGDASLLLFQTVMLGGSLFVDLEHLMKVGYTTRRSARQVFYERARVNLFLSYKSSQVTILIFNQALYEGDYEQDSFSIAQALLLMGLWWETPGSHKDCWYWTGLAIGVIEVISIDMMCESGSIERKRLRKWRRLCWWCFVRDRIVSVGMKLPTRLSIKEYKMPMLELDDFDDDLSSDLQALNISELSWSTKNMRQIYKICIEEAKLCVCMDHFVRVERSVVLGNLSTKKFED